MYQTHKNTLLVNTHRSSWSKSLAESRFDPKSKFVFCVQILHFHSSDISWISLKFFFKIFSKRTDTVLETISLLRRWLRSESSQNGACHSPLFPSKGRFPLRRVRPRDQAMGYQGMRSSKSKLKASVYWRMQGQFWKLSQVQLFCDQNERKPIRLLLFNARACDRAGSRDQIRWSGNRPQVSEQTQVEVADRLSSLSWFYLNNNFVL